MASQLIRALPTASQRAVSLLQRMQFSPLCPCHSNPSFHDNPRPFRRSLATPTTPSTDYAFEMASSTIRFGPGCTSEVGMDLANLNLTSSVLVVTDPTVATLPVMSTVLSALSQSNISHTVYSNVLAEPTSASILSAIEFARPLQPTAYLAVGGGSVIDTAKLINLYVSHPSSLPFEHFLPPPIGAGLPPSQLLRPLIAIPTTAGTGSETTGTAIFDIHTPSSPTNTNTNTTTTTTSYKTGVSHRALRPSLGLVDPLNTADLPRPIAASSGLDVLCHALESYTAIPFSQRTPRPSNPADRPAYQGANPISDVFSMTALRSVIRNLPVALAPSNDERQRLAREEMLLASALAGVGFGNAGVHLCHGMSYPISSQVRASYVHNGYERAGDALLLLSSSSSSSSSSSPSPSPSPSRKKGMVPHGVSVAVTAPAVFAFTAASNPDRHREVCALFGVDMSRVKDAEVGIVLRDTLREWLQNLPGGDQPSGLRDLGFDRSSIEMLVEGVLPQRRVLGLAPGLSREAGREREQLGRLFEESM